MNENCKLQKNEAICFILIIMINKLILTIPYYIVSLVGTGSIINLIYIGILDFIFLLVLLKLFDKFQNSDIIDIAEFLGGKHFKNIVSIIGIIFFYIISFITLWDFSNILQTIYFTNFPKIYILLFFIFGITIANLVGFRGIHRTACFIVPFAIISILVTFLGTFKDIKLESFTPILGHNYYTTFVIGFSNNFAMYIITYYYLIKPLLKDPNEFKNIAITSYISSWFLLLLTVIPILTLFNGNTDIEPLNSLYLLSRKIEFRLFHKKN